MARNKISKRSDGRRSYQTTINGKRRTIYQRKGELLREFEIRCDELDRLAANSNISTLYNLSIESSFDDLFKTWQIEYQKSNNSKSDVVSLESNYFLHLKDLIGRLPLHKIDRALVYRILNNLVNKGYSKSTISKVRGCISRPFNWAQNQLGLRLESPTTGIKLKYKQTKKPIRVISHKEIEIFFSYAIKTKYYNYFRLLLLTGLRPSECLGLQVGDIKGNYLEINRAITRHEDSNLKTQSGNRKIPLTHEIITVLNDQLNLNSGIWLFDEEKPSMNAVEVSFKRIMKHIKPIRFSLYDFRHTFATRAAESGMPFNILQSLMGHKSINVTLKYYVGLSEEQEQETLKYLEILHSKPRHEQNDNSSNL